MQITLNDQEINQAILVYLRSQGFTFPGPDDVTINFTAGRGGNGNTATIETGSNVSPSDTSDGSSELEEGNNVQTDNFELSVAEEQAPVQKRRRRRKKKAAAQKAPSTQVPQPASQVVDDSALFEDDSVEATTEVDAEVDAEVDKILDNPVSENSDDQEDLFI